LNPLYRLAWVFYLALAVGGALWIGARRGEIPLALFLDRRGLALDLAAGGAAGAALLGVWRVAHARSAAARALEGHLRGLLGPLETREALALAALSGFAEELFFRGAVQGAWGFLPAAILFAALHSGWSAVFRLWTLYAALAGLLFGGLMLWRGNLLAPAVAHVLVNAVNLRRLARLPEPGAALDR
jgi:membrane protease YdiL (CAAX protease family)